MVYMCHLSHVVFQTTNNINFQIYHVIYKKASPFYFTWCEICESSQRCVKTWSFSHCVCRFTSSEISLYTLSCPLPFKVLEGMDWGLVEFSKPNFHNWGMVASSILKALNSSKLHTVPATMVRHELVPKRESWIKIILEFKLPKFMEKWTPNLLGSKCVC